MRDKIELSRLRAVVELDHRLWTERPRKTTTRGCTSSSRGGVGIHTFEEEVVSFRFGGGGQEGVTSAGDGTNFLLAHFCFFQDTDQCSPAGGKLRIVVFEEVFVFVFYLLGGVRVFSGLVLAK